MINLIGRSEEKVFGLLPGERLGRQARKLDACVVAHSSAVLDDNAMHWLIENPEVVLATQDGQPLAIVTNGDLSRAIRGLSKGQTNFRVMTPRAIGPRFIRKLRRKALPLAISLNEIPAREAEWLLFRSVYKEVTDLVTKWAWPLPAFVVTRLAAQLGVKPNVITFFGLLLTILAGWLFFDGAIAPGLLAAWAMTFLDTVDGKLARVTVTSSRIGNWLDHGTDVIHPPLWWACLAHGLTLNAPDSSEVIWMGCGTILVAYFLARGIEVSFHLVFGFNGYLLSGFDAKFRLVVARRNVLLGIMSVGLLVGASVEAFLACAGWSVASTAIQATRFAQACVRGRTSKPAPYLA